MPATLLFVVLSADLTGQSVASGGTAGPKTPPISGIVVDAFTGKPIASVDVVLRASVGGASRGADSEKSVTSPNGRFEFPARLESQAAGFFAGITELSLSVNRVLVSAVQMQAPSDVTLLAQHGTIFDVNSPMNLQSLGRLSNRSYFPVSVQFLRDCNVEWAATCISASPAARVRIPLIPVLNDPAGCDRLRDPQNRERCRQLNTYRAAFLHLETIAQVRQDKKLCEGVDQGSVSQRCLEHLHRDVQLRAPPQGSVTPPADIDPTSKVLILTPVAGLVAGSRSLGYADLFEETATYGARYSSATERWGVDPILATVDVLGTEPTRKDIISRLASDGGFLPGTEKEENVDGNRVTTLERGTVSSVAWISGRRVVGLQFNRYGGFPQQDRAVAAAAQGWPELIRAYLRKYPSSTSSGPSPSATLGRRFRLSASSAADQHRLKPAW
jgi:hypothetical protein